MSTCVCVGDVRKGYAGRVALTLTPGGAFRFHWPMQGPHAFASTTPPASSKIAVNPSASIAFATATDPGVT